MAETLVTADRLAQSFDALYGASIWGRLPGFLRHLDIGLAEDTARLFAPAFPLSAAGILYALAGAVVGYFLATGCIGGQRWIRERLARERGFTP